MQGVEGMEKFFLGGFLTSDELDIIDKQDINLTVLLPEGRGGMGSDGIDQVVGKFL